MSELCRVCRRPLATEADHAEFEAVDWCAPANGDPDDYRLDLCWSEYAGGEHLDADGELIEDELEHVIGQRDAAEAEVARLTAQVERMATSDAADCDAAVRRLRHEMGELRDELRQARGERDELRAEVARLTAAIAGEVEE